MIQTPRFDKKNFLIKKFEDDAVAFSLRNNVPYVLNHTALRVLELSNGKRDVSGIAGVISKEHDCEVKTVKKDVNEVIKKFKKVRILEK